MTHLIRDPSLNPPRFAVPTSESRSVSPDKGRQGRSLSPVKGKQALRDNGMIDGIAFINHKYPSEKEKYLQKFLELPEGYIPSSLKTTIAETYHDDPSLQLTNRLGAPDLRLSCRLYYDSSLTDSGTDFDALMKIQEEAKYCNRHSSDENGWCQGVVVPLLNSALHEPKFSTGKVISVQSQTINPLFAVNPLSAAPSDNANDLAQKKIDYVIFLDDDSKETHALYKALKQRVPKGSQGLWTHESTANLIPLFIFEVKADKKGEKEGEFQLMTAAQAFLKYLQSLLDFSASESKKNSLVDRLPPVIGWVVVQHEWKAYVSYSIGGGRWNWVPLSSADGTTSSRGESIRLLRTIETLKTHFGRMYMAWLNDVFLSNEAEG